MKYETEFDIKLKEAHLVLSSKYLPSSILEVIMTKICSSLKSVSNLVIWQQKCVIL